MAMGSADSVSGMGEADGGIGMVGDVGGGGMGESLQEEHGNDIVDRVAEHFGTYNVAPEWKTFILPDGRFLNMDKLRAHSDVEQWLINNGLSKEKFPYIHMGSPTLSKLGCFRCNPRGRYCILPEVDYPTDEALNSLLLWLDSQSSNGDYVTIVTPSGKSVRYSFSDYISDDIVDRIDRFYTSGTLYEKHVDIKRAGNAKYERNPVGEKLSLCKINESVKAQKEMEFLQASKSDSWNRRRRIEIGERYKRRAVGEKLSVEEKNKESWLSDQIKKFRSTKKGDFLYSAHRLSTTVDPKFLEQIYNQNPNLSVDELLTVAGLQKETGKKSPPKNNRKEKGTQIKRNSTVGKPIMEDTVIFYYNPEYNPEDDVFEVEEDELMVDKEDVIQALLYLLRDNNNFVFMDDEEFEKIIRDNWRAIKDDYYDDLQELFKNKASHDAEGYDSDDFYDDEVCSCEEEPEEEIDPYFTEGLFEGIDSEDPEVRVTKYDNPSKSYLKESFEEDEDDLEDRYHFIARKSVYDADGFTTDYTMYYDSGEDKYVMVFGDSDIYSPEDEEFDAEFEDEDTAREWFDNYEGFTEEDMDECLHPEAYLPSSFKKATNPYDDVVDNFYGYDDEYLGHRDDVCPKCGKEPCECKIEESVIRYPNGMEVTDIDLDKALDYQYGTDRDKDNSKYADDEKQKAVTYWIKKTDISPYDVSKEEVEIDDNPLEEAAVKDIDVGLHEDPEYRKKLVSNIEALRSEIDFLTNQAPREIRRGGAFDSQEEIDDAIEDTQRELNRELAKLRIIDRDRR